MANPKILGTLTLVIILISGFFAYKNKQAYESEIAQTAAEHRNLEASKKRLKEAQATLAATISQREGIEAEIAKLQVDEADQKKLNKDLKTELDEKTAKAGKFDTGPDSVRQFEEKVTKLKDAVIKLTQLKADIELLDKEIADRDSRLAQLNSSNGGVEKQIEAMRGDTELRNSGRSFPHLKTRIRSVYPTWGFVTLAHGDRSGVVMSSTLDVVRNGETVAKLFVSTVERDSSSASIVPGSVSQDVVLMSGDVVVPAKYEAPPVQEVIPASAPAAEAPPAEAAPAEAPAAPAEAPAAPAEAPAAEAPAADAAPAEAPADASPF